MIEAEMYGMIPSAKIVSLRRLPPENRSRKPRMPPPCWRKKDSSAWKLIPGTGMCPPMRYWSRPRDYLSSYLAMMASDRSRAAHPAVVAWAKGTRLSPKLKPLRWRTG